MWTQKRESAFGSFSTNLPQQQSPVRLDLAPPSFPVLAVGICTRSARLKFGRCNGSGPGFAPGVRAEPTWDRVRVNTLLMIISQIPSVRLHLDHVLCCTHDPVSSGDYCVNIYRGICLASVSLVLILLARSDFYRNSAQR